MARAVDQVFGVGGVEQQGQVALDDLAHPGRRGRVLGRQLGAAAGRLVAQAVEQRGQQLRVDARRGGCIGPAGRAGAGVRGVGTCERGLLGEPHDLAFSGRGRVLRGCPPLIANNGHTAGLARMRTPAPGICRRIRASRVLQHAPPPADTRAPAGARCWVIANHKEPSREFHHLHRRPGRGRRRRAVVLRPALNPQAQRHGAVRGPVSLGQAFCMRRA
ncbi:hypothetical protein D3C72_1705680 [compost metagenome]